MQKGIFLLLCRCQLNFRRRWIDFSRCKCIFNQPCSLHTRLLSLESVARCIKHIESDDRPTSPTVKCRAANVWTGLDRLTITRNGELVWSAIKARDTLSSRHVSSCDVTRAVGMWEVIWYWILWRRFTLLSLCLRHVISRGALVGSRSSTPLTFLMSHTFRETWGHDNRNVRGVLAREPTRAPHEVKWRKQSDRSVNLRRRIQCQIASHIPTARVRSHELTWLEDSVSPA
jgi:hypothetical protein